MIERINFFYDTQKLTQEKTPSQVAKSFEAMFYSFFMKEISNSLSSGHSFSYNFYFDMFMMQMAQVMADSGQLKLGDYILKAIESYQQNQNQRIDVGEDTTVSNKS